MSGEAGQAAGRGGTPRRLTTILAADLCGYSAISEADPEGALAAVKALTARIEEAAQATGGRLFHRAGDGFLCELPTATAGVQTARRLTEGLIEAPIEAGGGPISLRIGVHTGEVTEEASGDLLGHAVNVAARLGAEAPRGGTVISAATQAFCESCGPVRRMGELKLRNIREPVSAYELMETDGFAARLRTRFRSNWLRRNQAALSLATIALVLAGAVALGSLASRDRALRAERAAEERAAELARNAEVLAEQLTTDEERVLARRAVEDAALTLLSSTEPVKAEAQALALRGDALGTARALRGVYDSQRAAGAADETLAQTALQCGAFAFGQDQALAQFCYERAYELMPREPLVLHRLASIATDRNQDDDARSYLSALLATGPSPRWVVEAETDLAFIAQSRRRYDEAERRLRRALAIARADDLSREEAAILNELGSLAIFKMPLALEEGPEAADRLAATAEADLRRGLRVMRALRDAEGTIDALTMLAQLAQIRADFATARDRYEEVFALIADRGDRPALASAAFNLAAVANAQGDMAARDRYWQTAFEQAEAASLEALLGILHAAKAGYAYAEGDAAAACGQLVEASAYAAEGDLDIAAMREAMMPGLECGALAEAR